MFSWIYWLCNLFTNKKTEAILQPPQIFESDEPRVTVIGEIVDEIPVKPEELESELSKINTAGQKKVFIFLEEPDFYFIDMLAYAVLGRNDLNIQFVYNKEERTLIVTTFERNRE